MIRRIGELARVELVRRIRNRSAVITAFVAPLAVAVVFGLLIGGGDSARFKIGVVDLDSSEASSSLVAGLLAPPAAGADASPVEFRPLLDRQRAFAAVDDGKVDAAIVIRPGFGAGPPAGSDALIEVLRSPDRVISGQVARAVASSIAARANEVNLALATTSALTGTAPTADTIDSALALDRMIEVGPADEGSGVDAYAFYGAAMAILFLFFTMSFAGRSLMTERKSGLLARVQSTPATPAEILLGKSIAVSVLALAGFVTVWLVTSFVFGARWGDPLSVFVVIVATVAAIAGIATFVAAFARSEQQADAITSAAAFTLALLGGNFVGPDAPALLARLSLLTPNGWALRAFLDLSADPVGLHQVAVPVAILLAFALAFGSFGAVRLHRGFRP